MLSLNDSSWVTGSRRRRRKAEVYVLLHIESFGTKKVLLLAADKTKLILALTWPFDLTYLLRSGMRQTALSLLGGQDPGLSLIGIPTMNHHFQYYRITSADSSEPGSLEGRSTNTVSCILVRNFMKTQFY